MTDCVIIGSGVAGISAALTLKARGIDFVLFGDKNLSGKIEKAEQVKNYPAFLGKSGAEFRDILQRQLEQNGIAVSAGRAVGIYKGKNTISVQTDKNEWIEAQTAILACGVAMAESVKGEKEFLGRGVSYCATCDAALYKGKTVLALVESEEFFGDIEVLENTAKKVFISPMGRGSKENFAYLPKKESTEICTDQLVEITGDLRIKKAVFSVREVEIDGVFILKESLPLSSVCGGLKTDGRHVVVDRQMRTNLEGIFAAGDCTGTPYQYAKAAGEGNVAAHSVAEFLRKR